MEKANPSVKIKWVCSHREKRKDIQMVLNQIER